METFFDAIKVDYTRRSPAGIMGSTLSKCDMIKNHLIQGIQSRQLGGKLPSENQLAKKFNVSRMTARKAVGELVSAGLVEQIQGKGTFVRQQDFSMGYFSVQPSRQHARDLGMDYASKVLEQSMLQAPPERVALRLDYCGQTVCARRLHFFDHRPVRYEIRHLRGDLCGGILWENLETASIHELLVTRYKLPLSRVWQRIQAVNLDNDTALILGEDPGYPAFYIERVTFSANQAVTYVEYYIRGEFAFEDSFTPESLNRMTTGRNGSLLQEDSP